MYLLIQNTGVAPIEAFTVLGVSTARGNTDKIGQFGSGGKHSINLLLRAGLNPVIYLGENELKFFSKPDFMGDKQYNRIYYSFKGDTEKTGFSLEFGEMDWNKTEMALREIISNAIDAVGVENVVLDIVNEAKPYSDSTSVYIPLTPEVQIYYNNLSEKFLHFVGKDKLSILDNTSETQARIYRKGVFVRTINKFQPRSLFHYNLGDESKIDESRNMSDGSCLSEASKLVGNSYEHTKKYVASLQYSERVWEDSLYSWHLNKDFFNKAWKEVYGEAVACDSPQIGELVRKRGIDVIYVRNINSLREIGIPMAEKFLTHVENKGYKIIEPNNTTQKNFNKVWRKLVGIGLTNDLPKPALKNFTSAVKIGQGMVRGYYENSCVFINVDDQGSYQTILEELAHYITGAPDGSREFQEFAFNVACRLVPQWNE